MMLVSIRDIIERAIQVGILFDVWLVEHVSYHLACLHKGYHGASCICGGVSLSYWLQCNAHFFALMSLQAYATDERKAWVLSWPGQV